MKHFKKRAVTLGAVVVLAAIAWWMVRPQPVSVDIATVSRGPLQVTVQDDGRTRIREKYIVSSPVAGRLIRIDLKPGDTVSAGGTVLAVIEPSDPTLLDPRSLAEARAREKASEARLAQVEPRQQLAGQRLRYAELELERTRDLAEKGAVSQQVLQEAELALEAAQAEQAEAAFLREIAEYELRMAQAVLTHTGQPASYSEADQYRFPIQAPITGKVLRVMRESTTVVQAGEPLLELGDPSDLEIEADVLSTDAVKIRPGAKVYVEHWGGDVSLNGKVRLIEPSAFTKVSALGIEEQRVNVIIDFDRNEDLSAIGDGYRVEASVVVWEADDVLKVPLGALFRDGLEWAVLVNEGGRASRRSVRIGSRNDSEAEVLEGLEENTKVILHPGDRVVDGSRLRERSL